ncbi:ABC transporter ATP-binding protein [Halobaculum marinum]|uniref:ABC transporter ATP-binding protein n=1 Tax=Halobaculum marinum TaxID=3031996 RepID=A0ABD5X373_9EURY|nr:ABC transporter ATP-binding protein [Halobaculum sp. DT55]
MTRGSGADAAASSAERVDRSGSTAHGASATEASPAREDAVVVENLRKRFGSGDDAVTAVDGVSLRIERGSVVGLLGPNGAGKTTLIKSILGMVLPDEGSVTLLGADVLDDPRGAYGRVDAMLEGARNDYWRLTVRENLRYFTTISGVDPDSVADRHERILRQLDLADKADTPVRDLSRGMKQKVSLATVLAGGAEVVFLDEPTLGLDVESSRTLQRELRRLAEEEDLTVVLSSHDMDVIETVCDRVVIVSDGRVVADDTVDALLRNGGVSAVRVASPDLDDALVDTVRDRFDVTDATELDGEDGTRIEVAVDSDGLYDLLAFLRSRDVRLHAVRTVEPNLEDVFVSLTGLDDSGASGTTEADR